MKKFCLIFVCFIFVSVLLSACSIKNDTPTIKYKRKLEKYFSHEENQGGTIDLSEGPKLKYNTNFGPQDLNFDIKIVNPY